MRRLSIPLHFLFFFHATPPPEIYPLSLHDALPIFRRGRLWSIQAVCPLQHAIGESGRRIHASKRVAQFRSEEHTSELQSHHDLVCRLLLEKKKKKNQTKSTRNSPHQPRP